MAGQDLSLTAELFLLAIDPARGGLYPRRRRRFRRALAAALRLDRGGTRRLPFDARRARRRALRELEGLGLVERGSLGARLRLADRAAAAARFHRIRRCLAENDFAQPRDRFLAILLGWSGVLAKRLSEWVTALGRIELEAQEVLLADALSDLTSGDFGGLDPGYGGGYGGGESWGGESGGGGQGR